MTSNYLDKTIAAMLLAAVAFTALAHGTVEPWSVAIFESIILIILLLWTIKTIIDKELKLKVPLTAWPIAVFLVFGLIQSFSYTGSSNGLVSSLSFDPEATRGAAELLFFLLIAHVAAANFFTNESRVRMMVGFLTIFGLFLAVFGIIQYFTWNGNIYWIIPGEGSSTGVIGPFLNHAHFAGFMELIVPLPVSLILAGSVKNTRVLYGFAATVIAVTIVASLSRGGIISLCGGLLFVAVAGFSYTAVKSFRRRKKKSSSSSFDQPGKSTEIGEYNRNGGDTKVIFSWAFLSNIGAVVLIVAAILLGTIWLGLDPVVDRVTNNNIVSTDEKAPTFEASRGWVWRNAEKIFFNNPVSGVGLGAFETAYPNYGENNGLKLDVDRVHNDYLQVLTDTGLIGGAITLWFIFTLLLLIKKGLVSSNSFCTGLSIGIGGAIFSLMIHSLFDFNLQMPSNALLFLILTAVLGNLPNLPDADTTTTTTTTTAAAGATFRQRPNRQLQNI